MTEIRFVTSNQWKLKEAESILGELGIKVIPFEEKLAELQTADTQTLVKDKALKAFRIVGRPLFVEHTGLYLRQLNGLPGGLTQIFWDKLEADRFASLYGSNGDTVAVAKTVIGFVDGKNFFTFEGLVKGTISSEPRGPREFQWDCIFVPKNSQHTFAEMGDEKNKISMRRIALDEFAKHLRSGGEV